MEEYLVRYSVVLRVMAEDKATASASSLVFLRRELPEYSISSIKFKECVKADIAYKRSNT